MATIHSSVDKLLEDIRIPTEEREPQSNRVEIIMPEPEKEIPKGAVNNDAPVQDAPEPMSEEMLEASADITIGLIDFTQANAFKFFGNRKKKVKAQKLYGDDWKTKLEFALNEIEAREHNTVRNLDIVRELTPEEIGLLRLEKSAQEYLEGLALTDDEKNAIKIPLMAIMRKRGGSIPPELALLIAAGQILGARGAELAML